MPRILEALVALVLLSSAAAEAHVVWFVLPSGV